MRELPPTELGDEGRAAPCQAPAARQSGAADRVPDLARANLAAPALRRDWPARDLARGPQRRSVARPAPDMARLALHHRARLAGVRASPAVSLPEPSRAAAQIRFC